jgi:hypothetical protein
VRLQWDGAQQRLFKSHLRVSLGGRPASTHGAAWNHNMDLIEYFEQQKHRCERELKYADAPGFQLFERTYKASTTLPSSMCGSCAKPGTNISG